MLQKVIPVFRNPDPVAFLDSCLLEIKIIWTHHLAQKTCLIIHNILHYKPACQNLCIFINIPSNVKVHKIITCNLCLYGFFLTSVIIISRQLVQVVPLGDIRKFTLSWNLPFQTRWLILMKLFVVCFSFPFRKLCNIGN